MSTTLGTRTRSIAGALGATLALALALTLTACTGSSPDPVPVTNSPQVTATPTATSASDTLVGKWIVSDTYRSPDQPYLQFALDGTWVGSDGCNSATGTWMLSPDGALTASSSPVTQIYCDGSPLPRDIISAVSVKFDNGALSLVGHDGNDLVKLTKPTSVETPVASGTNVVLGLWTNTEPGRDRLLQLKVFDDGTVSGNDGCNDFTSTWRFADDGSVSFGPLQLTKRVCDGVVTWLSGASTAVLDGPTMVIRSQFGAQLGTLTYTKAVPATLPPTSAEGRTAAPVTGTATPAPDASATPTPAG